MKSKKIIQILVAITSFTLSLFSHAHEGHAPPGVVHELHHFLWVAMALAVSAVAVFLIRRNGKKNTEE